MTTSELIAKLKELDPEGNLQVLLWDDEYDQATKLFSENLEVNSFTHYKDHIYFIRHPATKEKYLVIGF